MIPKEINIVVVDDDEAMRNLIADCLVDLGGSVARFGNGTTAWDHIKNNHADIVISDVHMDGMQGLELLSNVKENFPSGKCIMISGDPSAESRAMRMGADAFVPKPFEVNALRLVVSRCMG